MVRFSDKVKELSDGRIVIDVHHSGILGDWVQVFEELMRGTIEMASTPLASVYDPRLDIVYIPYLVKSWDEAKKSYTPGGFIFDASRGILNGLGLEALASVPWGFNGMGTSIRPPSPEDPNVPKPVKIRVWPAIPPEKMIDALGYMVVVMPWSDVFSAMQMGTIDGYYGPDIVTAWHLVRDVTDYWEDYRCFFEGHFHIINKELWDSLSVEDQDILQRAAIEQQDKQIADAVELEEEAHTSFKDYGVEIITFTPEQKSNLADVAIEKVWPEL